MFVSCTWLLEFGPMQVRRQPSNGAISWIIRFGRSVLKQGTIPQQRSWLIPAMELEVLQLHGNRALWSEWKNATHSWVTRASTKALGCTRGAATFAFWFATPRWSSRGRWHCQIGVPKPKQHWKSVEIMARLMNKPEYYSGSQPLHLKVALRIAELATHGMNIYDLVQASCAEPNTESCSALSISWSTSLFWSSTTCNLCTHDKRVQSQPKLCAQASSTTCNLRFWENDRTSRIVICFCIGIVWSQGTAPLFFLVRGIKSVEIMARLMNKPEYYCGSQPLHRKLHLV